MFRKFSKLTLLVLWIGLASVTLERPLRAQETAAEVQSTVSADESTKTEIYIPELADAIKDVPQKDPNFNSDAATEKFNEWVELWRSKLQSMNAAAIRFHNGINSEASKYRTDYQTAGNEARDAFDRAFSQAVLLMEQAPSKNLDAAQFAMMATFYRFNRNWYETTGESAAVLLNALPDNRGLPEITGVSLYCTSQFERARSYLQRAVELGLMEGENFGLLQQIDDMIVLWNKEQELRAIEAERDDLPRVLIRTTKGDIIVELFEDQVPNTVANFISLVEEDAYRGVPFYQVLSGQVALVGDVRLDPMSSPFFLMDEDAGEDNRHPFRGTLCMAKVPTKGETEKRTFENSASSHFFIPFRPMPASMTEHVCFGRIIEGMGHFSLLNRVDSTEKKDDETEVKQIPDLILSTEVIRKRNHDYKADRILNPLVNGERAGADRTESESQ